MRALRERNGMFESIRSCLRNGVGTRGEPHTNSRCRSRNCRTSCLSGCSEWWRGALPPCYCWTPSRNYPCWNVYWSHGWNPCWSPFLICWSHCWNCWIQRLELRLQTTHAPLFVLLRSRVWWFLSQTRRWTWWSGSRHHWSHLWEGAVCQGHLNQSCCSSRCWERVSWL